MKIRIPHKVKIFFWRFCRNNIPVCNLLRSKRMTTTIFCPMCGTDVEHLLHEVFDCEFAKQCRHLLDLKYDMNLMMLQTRCYRGLLLRSKRLW